VTSLSPFELIYCALVVFVSYAVRGGTGFGAVIGMPLIALVLPMKDLVPVWTLMGFTSSVAILGRDRKHVANSAVLAFIPWCLIGIGIGLYFFATLDARMLARGLGIMVIAYAIYAMRSALRPPAKPHYLPPLVAPLSGALAGAVGALFGTMGSIFFVIFLDMRSLNKEQFRATMSAMLLVLSAVRGLGYYAVGEFTVGSFIMFAAAFPAMLAGIYVGDRVQMRLSEAAFRKVICVTLLLCGILLLLK
jgi:uncharacterized membrane protein YfcA